MNSMDSKLSSHNKEEEYDTQCDNQLDQCKRCFKLLRRPLALELRPFLLELSSISRGTILNVSTPVQRLAQNSLFESKLMLEINEFLSVTARTLQFNATGDKRFNGPRSVAFHEKRNEIFVLDSIRLQMLDLNGNIIRSIRAKPPVDFSCVCDFHLNTRRGTVLLAHRDHQVLVVDYTTGAILRSIGSWGSGGRGKFRCLSHMVMYSSPRSVGDSRSDVFLDKRIFVCDSRNPFIQVFSEDGVFLFQFPEDRNNFAPYHLAIDNANDELYVTEKLNNCVSVFSTSGEYRRTFGLVGSGPKELRDPEATVLHPFTSEVIVADGGNNRLQVFDRQGNFLRSIGTHGTGNSHQFSWPCALAVHNISGHVAVADKCNNRVQVLPW